MRELRTKQEIKAIKAIQKGAKNNFNTAFKTDCRVVNRIMYFTDSHRLLAMKTSIDDGQYKIVFDGVHLLFLERSRQDIPDISNTYPGLTKRDYSPLKLLAVPSFVTSRHERESIDYSYLVDVDKCGDTDIEVFLGKGSFSPVEIKIGGIFWLIMPVRIAI